MSELSSSPPPDKRISRIVWRIIASIAVFVLLLCGIGLATVYQDLQSLGHDAIVGLKGLLILVGVLIVIALTVGAIIGISWLRTVLHAHKHTRRMRDLEAERARTEQRGMIIQQDIVRVPHTESLFTVGPRDIIPHHLATIGATKKLYAQPDEDELDGQTMSLVPPPYDFVQELSGIWRPSTEGIFLARASTCPLLAPLHDTWHIVFTGPTGGGKTNIMRLILVQVLYVGAKVYFLNKHYAPIERTPKGEIIDWRPIAARLACPVIRHVDEMEALAEQIAQEELPARIERGYLGEPIGEPLYLAVEELPAVIAERPAIMDHVSFILREGRKYGIYFVGATQDVLVKTLGSSSGVRENLRTGYYTGGDATSAKVVLDLQRGQTIDENGIGQKGLVYLKSPLNQAQRVRVPFVSNEAVYALLGSPGAATGAMRDTPPSQQTSRYRQPGRESAHAPTYYIEEVPQPPQLKGAFHASASNPKLQGELLTVYNAMRTHKTTDKRKLAAGTGINESTVYRRIQQLKDMGYIA